MVGQCSLIEEVELLRERCRKLEELSFVDALTGLFNFRYMQRALEMEMERSRRTKLPTGLIMLDLDHFKNVNTVYGHEGGNVVLAHLGKLLKESVRVIDIPCRYGGEEFALILPNASTFQATSIAKRLRELVRERPVEIGAQTLPISASFGVAVFRHTDEDTLNSFISRADRLLYEAKSAGRDRICAEQPPAVSMAEEVSVDEKSALFFKGDE
ncbi:MAG: GGDEF domain-containing protein [Syntrophobacteraceae bacterium]|nr:GGDEF domain-containing protein [Syntrophobacteraceae bacterium]